MCDYKKQKCTIWLVYISVWIVIHIFIRCNYLDDLANANTYAKYNGDIITATIYSYMHWDPRVFIHFVFMFLAGYSWWVWKILDIMFLCLLLYSIDKMINLERNNKVFIFEALLILCYPFCHQGSTGWIATTTNHLWAITAGIYCISVIIDSQKNNKQIKIGYIVIFTIAMLYATNMVTVNAIMICVLVIFLCVVCSKKKSIDSASLKMFYTLWGISATAVCINTIMYVSCPGNRARNLADIAWVPDWGDMHLPDKLRLGFGSIIAHMVSIPNAVLFLLCFSLVIISYAKFRKHHFKLIVALLPMCMDVFWTSFFAIQILTGRRELDYYIPEAVIKSEGEVTLQTALIISYIIMIITMLIVMHWIIEERKMYGGTVAICAFGHIPGMMLGFSPTIVTSSLRTNIGLYLAMIICIIILVTSNIDLISKKLWNTLYILCGFGVVFNLIQVFRHIVIWG